eukprot:Skav207100  [mRNA]  locus=scaffold2123:117802:122235:+ [translate_table: standard]
MQLVVADSGDSENDDAQAENAERDKEKRPWTQVNLDEIFNLYSDSIEVKGLSLQQIVRSKGRNQEVGCSETAVVNWLGKIQAMYQQRASLGDKDEIRLNMVSDGSRHSTRDTWVTCFFAPEADVACYGDSQVLKISKTKPGEIACDVGVERLLAQKKADRVVAYRLLQGLSKQLHNVTGGALDLEALWCDNAALAPLSSKEIRIISADGRTVSFVNKQTREVIRTVSVPDLVKLPVLVLGMDQGAPGMACSGYMHTKGLIEFYYDPIHRLARDMKGAVSAAPALVKKRLTLAQLAGAYLWSLSYKPFRSGSFHQDKVELLEMFMGSESQDIGLDSDIFAQYSSLLSLDMGGHVDNLEMLFESLAELETFRNKKSTVKTGRWFSFQNAASDHFKEFWASRMLLQALYPSEKSPDERNLSGKSFAELRKEDGSAGGLRLALRCTSWEVWYSITALVVGAKPLWKWYGATIKEVKTPSDAMQRAILLSGEYWMMDDQLTHLVKSFADMDELGSVLQYHKESFFHFGERADTSLKNFVEDLFYYILGLLGKRASSLSAFNRPPDCYGKLLHEDPAVAHGSFQMLVSDWKNLMLLEHSSNEHCVELASDMGLTVSKPMRIVYQLYEGGFVREARQLFVALVKRFPDTKLVEDVHQRLRMASLGNPNGKLGLREVQSLVETSLVFESRKINHPARAKKARAERKLQPKSKAKARAKAKSKPKPKAKSAKRKLSFGAAPSSAAADTMPSREPNMGNDDDLFAAAGDDDSMKPPVEPHVEPTVEPPVEPVELHRAADVPLAPDVVPAGGDVAQQDAVPQVEPDPAPLAPGVADVVPAVDVPQDGDGQPAPLVPAAAREPFARGPVVNHNPDILQSLVPPGATIHLNCGLVSDLIIGSTSSVFHMWLSVLPDYGIVSNLNHVPSEILAM